MGAQRRRTSYYGLETAGNVAASERLESGVVIAGRYRIGEKLGEGAVGAVYYAEHVTVGRACAVKVLSHAWASNRAMTTRFRKEARAATAAGHPGIIDVLDAGELEDGRPFIVMEYLAGRNLWQVIDSEAPLPVERACRFVRDVARALDAAHSVGVIHRDLKPENVMVVQRDDQEQIKVLDFGIAAASVSDGSPRATLPGMVMGTPAYMAPEQAIGEAPTPSLDIYAAGCLMFELLTARLPFEGKTPLDLLVKKGLEPAPSIATFRADLPPALVSLVDECLAMKPEDRPPHAGAVARRAQAILDEASVPVVAVPRSDHATAVVEAAPPRQGWIGIAVALLLLVGLVGAYRLWVAAPEEAQAAIAPPERAEVEPAEPQRPEPAVAPEPEPAPEPIPPPVAEAEVQAPPEPASPTADDPSDDASPRLPRKEEGDDASPAKPEPEPKPEPAVAKPKGPSPAECERQRELAAQAREQGFWSAVLTHTQSAACWDSERTERRKLRANAYLNLNKYDRCIDTGKGATDEATRKIVATCEYRLSH